MASRIAQLRNAFGLDDAEQLYGQFSCAHTRPKWGAQFLQGQLYVFSTVMVFHANLLAIIKVERINFKDVHVIRKRSFMRMPNTIAVSRIDEHGHQHDDVFTSFLFTSRRKAFDVMVQRWRAVNPEVAEAYLASAGSSSADSFVNGANSDNSCFIAPYATEADSFRISRNFAPGSSTTSSLSRYGSSSRRSTGGGGYVGSPAQAVLQAFPVWKAVSGAAADALLEVPDDMQLMAEADVAGVTPTMLAEVLLSDLSGFLPAVYKAQGNELVSLTPWQVSHGRQPCPFPPHSQQPAGCLTRTLQYIYSTTGPWGAVRALVVQEHMLLLGQNGQVVLIVTQRMPDLPAGAGKCFHMQIRWDVTPTAAAADSASAAAAAVEAEPDLTAAAAQPSTTPGVSGGGVMNLVAAVAKSDTAAAAAAAAEQQRSQSAAAAAPDKSRSSSSSPVDILTGSRILPTRQGSTESTSSTSGSGSSSSSFEEYTSCSPTHLLQQQQFVREGSTSSQVGTPQASNGSTTQFNGVVTGIRSSIRQSFRATKQVTKQGLKELRKMSATASSPLSGFSKIGRKSIDRAALLAAAADGERGQHDDNATAAADTSSVAAPAAAAAQQQQPALCSTPVAAAAAALNEADSPVSFSRCGLAVSPSSVTTTPTLTPIHTAGPLHQGLGAGGTSGACTPTATAAAVRPYSPLSEGLKVIATHSPQQQQQQQIDQSSMYSGSSPTAAAFGADLAAQQQQQQPSRPHLEAALVDSTSGKDLIQQKEHLQSVGQNFGRNALVGAAAAVSDTGWVSDQHAAVDAVHAVMPVAGQHRHVSPSMLCSSSSSSSTAHVTLPAAAAAAVAAAQGDQADQATIQVGTPEGYGQAAEVAAEAANKAAAAAAADLGCKSSSATSFVPMLDSAGLDAAADRNLVIASDTLHTPITAVEPRHNSSSSSSALQAAAAAALGHVTHSAGPVAEGVENDTDTSDVATNATTLAVIREASPSHSGGEGGSSQQASPAAAAAAADPAAAAAADSVRSPAAASSTSKQLHAFSPHNAADVFVADSAFAASANAAAAAGSTAADSHAARISGVTWQIRASTVFTKWHIAQSKIERDCLTTASSSLQDVVKQGTIWLQDSSKRRSLSDVMPQAAAAAAAHRHGQHMQMYRRSAAHHHRRSGSAGSSSGLRIGAAAAAAAGKGAGQLHRTSSSSSMRLVQSIDRTAGPTTAHAGTVLQKLPGVIIAVCSRLLCVVGFVGGLVMRFTRTVVHGNGSRQYSSAVSLAVAAVLAVQLLLLWKVVVLQQQMVKLLEQQQQVCQQ